MWLTFPFSVLSAITAPGYMKGRGYEKRGYKRRGGIVRVVAPGGKRS